MVETGRVRVGKGREDAFFVAVLRGEGGVAASDSLIAKIIPKAYVATI